MSTRAASLSVAVFVILNAVWLTKTIATSVGFVDSGELAIVCSSLGIAHPTGYPIYTLIGRVLTLFYPGSVISAVSFLSALFGLAAAVAFMLLIHRLVLRTRLPHLDTDALHVVSASAMPILLYAPLVWSLCTTNEVYSVHLFFMIAILCFAFVIHSSASNMSGRQMILMGYLLGLSFAHHLSTVLLIPGLALWIVLSANFRRALTETWKLSLLAAVLAITSYLYLPIRAAQNPLMNWGDPSTLDSLLRHVSGWQYRIWMFNKAPGEFLTSFGDLTMIVVRQYPHVLLPFAAGGIVFLLLKHRAFCLVLLTIFTSNLFYSAGYTIPEIDTYMLPTILLYALWIVLGTVFFVSEVCRRIPTLPKGASDYAVASLLLILGVYLVVSNRTFGDRSEYRYAKTQTEILFSTIDPRGVLLTSNWSLYGPAIYAQLVGGDRKDITALDVELLRRSWYYDYVQMQDPVLAGHIGAEIDRFLPLVRAFESGAPYDFDQIEDAYQSLLTAIVEVPGRPVYVDVTTKTRDLRNYTLVPDGLVYRVNRSGEEYRGRASRTMSLGMIDETLLQRDYMLRQQSRIVAGMNADWETYWRTYNKR
jgi:hypothetical protein